MTLSEIIESNSSGEWPLTAATIELILILSLAILVLRLSI